MKRKGRDIMNRQLLVAAIFGATLASSAQAQVDHLQCHKIKDTSRLSGAVVTLTAQQGAFQVPANCRIKGKAAEFCVPVSKGVVDPGDAPGTLIGPGQNLSLNDYVCYKVICPKLEVADTFVTDQFNARDLQKIKAPKKICVPAVKGEVVAITTTTSTSTTVPLGCSEGGDCRTFVTNATWTGNLGGLGGGDAKCNQVAADAGIPGNFVAWLSSESVNAKDRINPARGPYVKVCTQEGTLTVANGLADLVAVGSWFPSDLNCDENGAPTAEVFETSFLTWTGTVGGGTFQTGYTCSSWTVGSEAGQGWTGNSYRGDEMWTEWQIANCDSPRHLYCFEQ